MANFHSYLYNVVDVYDCYGSFTWTKPSDIDEDKPILVHVWGAGGSGSDAYNGGSSSQAASGGGGGGLAVKLIDVSSLGSTETVTVGDTANAAAQAGTSSFGAHCSASGGNGGRNSTTNQGISAYQVGGMGVGGDVNKRGGTGGGGYYASTSNCGGGGGGSAPAPYGHSDGYQGGDASSYAGGGGAGIGGRGNNGVYVGGEGGSSMGISAFSQSHSSYYACQPGASGLFGAGASASTRQLSYTTYGGTTARNGEPAQGTMILTPNAIHLGGGAGSSGCTGPISSGQSTGQCSSAGPGGGGGGVGSMSTNSYMNPGNGGWLGGGGGGSSYAGAGFGGNAGGGGGNGYYAVSSTEPHNGGRGLVIIQYARVFS